MDSHLKKRGAGKGNWGTLQDLIDNASHQDTNAQALIEQDQLEIALVRSIDSFLKETEDLSGWFKERLSELKLHPIQYTDQAQLLQLTDSQVAYLTVYGRIFKCSGKGIGIFKECMDTACSLFLAMDPSEDEYHPWVLFFRAQILMAQGFYFVNDKPELANAALFLEECLENYMESPKNHDLYCQMQYEVGLYYFLAQNYKKAKKYFDMVDHAISKNLVSMESDLIEFDWGYYQKLKKVLGRILQPGKSLVTAVKENSKNAYSLLFEDVLQQRYDVQVKKHLAYTVRDNKQLFSWIMFCNAVQQLLLNVDYVQVRQEFHAEIQDVKLDPRWIKQMLDHALMLDTKDMSRYQNWRDRLQVFFYSIEDDTVTKHVFMLSFFKEYPLLKMQEREGFRELERSNDVLGLLEMLLSQISSKEVQAIDNMTQLFAQYPQQLTPFVAQNAICFYKEQKFDQAIQLAQVAQMLSAQDLKTMMKTLENNCRHYKSVSLLQGKPENIPKIFQDAKHLLQLSQKKFVEECVIYCGEIFKKGQDNPKQSDEYYVYFTLARIMFGIAGITQALAERGMNLEKMDMTKLDPMTADQLVQFAQNLAKWVSGFDDYGYSAKPDTVKSVQSNCLDCLDNQPIEVWRMVLGFVGGILLQSLSETKSIRVEGLGPFSVFAVPGNEKYPGPPGLQVPPFLIQEPHLSLLIDFCESLCLRMNKKKGPGYHLLGDLSYYQQQYKEAIGWYTDAIFYDTKMLMDLQQFDIGQQSIIGVLVDCYIKTRKFYDAIFYLQFQEPINYNLIFKLVDQLPPSPGPLSPIRQGSENVLIWNIYVMEALIERLKKTNDPAHRDMVQYLRLPQFAKHAKRELMQFHKERLLLFQLLTQRS
ncbi:hypothetical protein EDD86DRAFT_278631 [Gorgonomyces haynaldii]|nr:hypothetical protein EDD86DRAFT_278631 [Gorgonomyces haynaldii]